MISNCDGDTWVEELSKDQVLSVANEREFLAIIPDQDTNYWPQDERGIGKSLIIKGEIVTPTPVSRVVEFDID